MKQYRLILIDTLILCVVSTMLAIGVYTAVAMLKGKVKKDDPIVTAILQANAKEVESLVKQAGDVTNETDDLGRTALMRAAFANYSDTRSEPGNEARNLLSDTDDKRAGIVALLLSHGAKPDSRDNDGWSALMWASWSGLNKVAAKLLECGASQQFTDRQGNTALIIAAQRGNPEIVRKLLAKGADQALTNKSGRTAREAATAGMAQYPEKRAAYTEVLAALR
ncbi:MAG: ankyrin repeat domain-containing protein [Verrucomicrobiota bacterium]